MDYKALIFTTWLRPRARQLFIITDFEQEVIEETTESGCLCGITLVKKIWLTPVGAKTRYESIIIDVTDFENAIRKNQMVQIIAPQNIDELSAQILRQPNLKPI